MTLPDIISLLLLVALPVAVSYRLFRASSGDRPRWATWLLAVMGGPLILILLNVTLFVLFGTNAVAGFAEPLVALVVSVISASVCALLVRPKPAPKEILNAPN